MFDSLPLQLVVQPTADSHSQFSFKSIGGHLSQVVGPTPVMAGVQRSGSGDQ
jgi:hypothetical protein